MCEQLDLFPDTVVTPKKRADERIDTYISMWRAERRLATLPYLADAIQQRLKLETA